MFTYTYTSNYIHIYKQTQQCITEDGRNQHRLGHAAKTSWFLEVSTLKPKPLNP